jgi:hypothetical protein
MRAFSSVMRRSLDGWVERNSGGPGPALGLHVLPQAHARPRVEAGARHVFEAHQIRLGFLGAPERQQHADLRADPEQPEQLLLRRRVRARGDLGELQPGLGD